MQTFRISIIASLAVAVNFSSVGPCYAAEETLPSAYSLRITPQTQSDTKHKSDGLVLVTWDATAPAPGSILTMGWRQKSGAITFPPENLLIPLVNGPGSAWIKLPTASGDYEAIGIIHGAFFKSDDNAWRLAVLARLRLDENFRHNVRAAADAGQSRYFVLAGMINVEELDGLADQKDGLEWYHKGADAGDPWAMVLLGRVLRKPDAPSADKSTAFAWFRKAAAKDYGYGQYKLAECYSSGDGVKLNSQESLHWLRKAAENGNGYAMTMLGSCYHDGTGVTKDEKTAVEWFLKAADLGEADAMNNLGKCYFKGTGVTGDEKTAIQWFRKAADLGEADAMLILGFVYDLGVGVTKDKTRAAEWYRKASDQGEAQAQCRLGQCYENGDGVAKDHAEAVKWYLKAADQGNADAQSRLGLCYQSGDGVPKDDAEAVKWFQKAAELGDAQAMLILGVSYVNGTGIAQDAKIGVQWFRKAAELGDAQAMNYLGRCYYTGTGVTKDEKTATQWYGKACSLGNKDAAKALIGFLKESSEPNPQIPRSNGEVIVKQASKAVATVGLKVRLKTTKGDIVLELNAEKAPITVENFLGYVKKKHYDGTVFHRVINGFMIQGGGFKLDGKDLVEKETGKSIVNEGKNGLKNDRGTVAMARTSDPNSATAQFFINVVGNPALNFPSHGGYAVFGRVVEGMDVVDKIKGVSTRIDAKLGGDVPVEPVVLQAATLIE